MKFRGIGLIITSFFLLACDKAKQIELADLPLYGVGPQSHTFYTGSDKKFHYFSWTRGSESGEFKVAGSELKLENPFPKGTDRAFIHKTTDGKIGLGMSPFNVHEKLERKEE